MYIGLYAKIRCHKSFIGELNLGCVAYLPHNLSPRDVGCYGARNVKRWCTSICAIRCVRYDAAVTWDGTSINTAHRLKRAIEYTFVGANAYAYRRRIAIASQRGPAWERPHFIPACTGLMYLSYASITFTSLELITYRHLPFVSRAVRVIAFVVWISKCVRWCHQWVVLWESVWLCWCSSWGLTCSDKSNWESLSPLENENLTTANPKLTHDSHVKCRIREKSFLLR
jgi:hypothetical protein